MLRLWFCTFVLCIGINDCQYNFDKNNFFSRLYRKSKDSDDKNTVFTGLGNYDVDSTLVLDTMYSWIGRVVHSRHSNYPHVCTAISIDKRIFITAAACIYTLKVNYTSVLYNLARLHPIAFVVPANSTKQCHDDIGFIIVKNEDLKNWPTIELFDTINRTDDTFQWFSDLFHDDEVRHKVIGYAVPKVTRGIISFDKQFHLSELPVVVNINLCPSILTFNNLISGFSTPCYHSCSVAEHKASGKACARYHGVEGGAVVNTETNKLLGVATWGPKHKHPLPVGFSVPNSESFFKNYDCAKRIRDNEEDPALGYQRLCNN